MPNYHIEVKILNAEDYGEAQIRRRAIFIGSRIGAIRHPEPTNIRKAVREAFYKLDNSIANQLDITKSGKEVIHRMSFVPQGGNWQDIPDELKGKRNKGATHSSYFKRLHYDKPSTTILNFRKNMILHPIENRIISVREGARLQGFPDDFVFHGTMASKQQMVANAVPVNMAKAIAENILLQLKYK